MSLQDRPRTSWSRVKVCDHDTDRYDQNGLWSVHYFPKIHIHYYPRIWWWYLIKIKFFRQLTERSLNCPHVDTWLKSSSSLNLRIKTTSRPPWAAFISSVSLEEVVRIVENFVEMVKHLSEIFYFKSETPEIPRRNMVWSPTDLSKTKQFERMYDWSHDGIFSTYVKSQEGYDGSVTDRTMM